MKITIERIKELAKEYEKYGIPASRMGNPYIDNSGKESETEVERLYKRYMKRRKENSNN